MSGSIQKQLAEAGIEPTISYGHDTRANRYTSMADFLIGVGNVIKQALPGELECDAGGWTSGQTPWGSGCSGTVARYG